MFKFNSDNIFTGYIKQLLHDFNLPKYRVYTKEQSNYAENYNSHIEEAALKKFYEDGTKLAFHHAQLTKFLEKAHDNNITALEEEINEKLNKVSDDIENLSLETIRNNLLQKATPELNVIETVYRKKEVVYPDTIDDENNNAIIYPLRMRYVPYIKDGKIQEYVKGKWHDCHETLELGHNKIHKNNLASFIQYYSYGQKILNYTKNLQIQNNVYDPYTHEYLGDYLRFHRDFANINLMPLYNCFSNRACPRLDIKFTIDNYEVNFNTNQEFNSALYKYYMVPVKFFKNYTIAIESEAAIELCCCVYGASQNKSERFKNIPALTYQCFSDSRFSQPKLYTSVNNLNSILTKDDESELVQYEDDLKLILKIPANNKSSIVILEGDYTRYNDSMYTNKVGSIELSDGDAVLAKTINQDSDIKNRIKEWNERVLGKYENKTNRNNQTLVNLSSSDSIEYLTDKLITPLQLLSFNTGESYPFADRLIEYLVGNTITLNEEIEDNIKRVKKVVSARHKDEDIDDTNGIWEPYLQILTYNYINKYHNSVTTNHDILGYVDKDVEKLYSCGTGTDTTTIANVDIYK